MNGWKAIAGGVLLSLFTSTWAALPAPTPEQAAAAAKKKADDAEQAAKAKQQLAESMERISEHWRRRAQAQGWQVHPPVSVDAAQGITASSTQTGPSGQQGGKLGAAAAEMPIRSEKHGTAPLSKDVKKTPPPDAVR